jgi:hypothetical protein
LGVDAFLIFIEVVDFNVDVKMNITKSLVQLNKQTHKQTNKVRFLTVYRHQAEEDLMRRGESRLVMVMVDSLFSSIDVAIFTDAGRAINRVIQGCSYAMRLLMHVLNGKSDESLGIWRSAGFRFFTFAFYISRSLLRQLNGRLNLFASHHCRLK